tara:strand:- start:18938 stop:20335 length:1398 start_codon:yes stop_codon:yes gene_type:complete
MGLLDSTSEGQYYQGNDYGNYQFTSLNDIITQFQIAYVGENKVIPKIKRADIAFHAQRAMQELSFDTFKSIKAQEITVPATLQMILPQDYVNYTKISWVDSAGIKHLLYPTSKTSNPTKPQQETDGDFLFDLNGNLIPSGNLLSGETLQGGIGSWEANVSAKDGSAISVVLEEPELAKSNGWVWDNNKLTLFNGEETSAGIPNGSTGVVYNAIRQVGVPIYSGETYTLTFTLSNYVAGSYQWHITDENGALFVGTAVTANGTYTQTIDMSASNTYFPNNTWDPQVVAFRNDNTGSGGDSVTIDNISIVRDGNSETSTTWSNYKSATPSENQDDYQDDEYWPLGGERYGLDPQHAQANGSFYIDNISGKIHFSSNISGKTVILDYISDSLGTDNEMQVHKFAEEAMYKHIAYAILSTSSSQLHQQLAPRFKKEKFAETRKAKLRLSNIKLEELTKILRGKSKQIKH